MVFRSDSLTIVQNGCRGSSCLHERNAYFTDPVTTACNDHLLSGCQTISCAAIQRDRFGTIIKEDSGFRKSVVVDRANDIRGSVRKSLINQRFIIQKLTGRRSARVTRLNGAIDQFAGYHIGKTDGQGHLSATRLIRECDIDNVTGNNRIYSQSGA